MKASKGRSQPEIAADIRLLNCLHGSGITTILIPAFEKVTHAQFVWLRCDRRWKCYPYAGAQQLSSCSTTKCDLAGVDDRWHIWLWVKSNGIPFWVGAAPILVFFSSGDWDVHWGYDLLTHGHMAFRQVRLSILVQFLACPSAILFEPYVWIWLT